MYGPSPGSSSDPLNDDNGGQNNNNNLDGTGIGGGVGGVGGGGVGGVGYGDDMLWSALTRTERWISDTLSSADGTGSSGGDDKNNQNRNNPYSRKEVSYVCDTSGSTAGTVAAAFRLVREAREAGECHGRSEAARRRRTIGGDDERERERYYEGRGGESIIIITLFLYLFFWRKFNIFIYCKDERDASLFHHT